MRLPSALDLRSRREKQDLKMDVARTPNFHISNEDDSLDLPPGFRFHPTDEELVTHYLSPKVLDPGFHSSAVAEVDLNKCEPWDLPREYLCFTSYWWLINFLALIFFQ